MTLLCRQRTDYCKGARSVGGPFVGDPLAQTDLEVVAARFVADVLNLEGRLWLLHPRGDAFAFIQLCDELPCILGHSVIGRLPGPAEGRTRVDREELGQEMVDLARAADQYRVVVELVTLDAMPRDVPARPRSTVPHYSGEVGHETVQEREGLQGQGPLLLSCVPFPRRPGLPGHRGRVRRSGGVHDGKAGQHPTPQGHKALRCAVQERCGVLAIGCQPLPEPRHCRSAFVEKLLQGGGSLSFGQVAIVSHGR
jgi:hypothetical protein